MITSVKNRIGPQPGKLLKGSDVVAAGKQFVTGVIDEAREAPSNFGAPMIIDFDADILPGIASWPCNITEMRKLASMIDDNPEKWSGYGIVLVVVAKNNPKTNRMVDSLEVARVVKPDKIAKLRKTKPAARPKGETRHAGVALPPDDEIPF